MILFTQSTVVLYKYLNDELKILCFKYFSGDLKYFSGDFSLRLHRIPSFPCSEKSLSIPGFPG